MDSMLSGLVWAFFYFFHSFFLINPVKTKIQSVTQLSNRGYRLWYNLFAVLSLSFASYLSYRWSGSWWFYPNTWSVSLGLLFLISGTIIGKMAFLSYSFKVFSGLQEETKPQFICKGLLKQLRHPLYSAALLLFFGLGLIFPLKTTLIFNIVTWLYLPVGIYLEESKLQQVFPEYTQYKKRVPALVPSFKNLFRIVFFLFLFLL